jgi:hypothetical protein
VAREVVVQEWCDFCIARGNRVLATWAQDVQIGKSKKRRLAGCNMDYEKTIKPFMDALMEVGTPALSDTPEENKPLPEFGGRVPCQYCARPIHPHGMTIHIKKKHPEQLGITPTASLTCPECGRDDIKAPQGLGAHMRHAHGQPGTSTTARRPRVRAVKAS